MEFIQFVEAKILQEGWSPDGISGYAKRHGLFEGNSVCTKTLDNYIDMNLLGVKNIDLPMKVRLNTKKKRSRQNQKVLGKSIEERPRLKWLIVRNSVTGRSIRSLAKNQMIKPY